MKVMLDTNVIMDALQDREPWAEAAKQIFREAALGRFVSCISAKACADIHYLAHRCTHSEADARNTLGKLFSLFDLLDTAAEDCQKALISETKDFEDAIMIETAFREGLDFIITRNEKDFSHSPVKVLDPESFLLLLDKQKKEDV